MKNKFRDLVIKELENSIGNFYYDNYDHRRFGRIAFSAVDKVRNRLKSTLFSKLNSRSTTLMYMERCINLFSEYDQRLERLFDLLQDDYSKHLLVKLIAYKILGHEKVKLPLNTQEYWSKLEKIEKFKNLDKPIDTGFLGWNLNKFDLNEFNVNVHIYLRPAGILHEFILEQYNYKNQIVAEKGDTVIDAGACWGDTALYFANKVGNDGKVVSFEFIPGNIDIFKRNLSLNEDLKSIIELIPNPLWENPDRTIYYSNNGPASQVRFEKFDGFQGSTNTRSIDDVVSEKRLSKVDFIKMDIEGAEPFALKGAFQTIQKHKPKLAIATYHSLDDFVNIPIWIDDLNLGYKIYLDHFTIHWEETVIYAKTL